MTWQKVLGSKLFLFGLLIAVTAVGYFFVRELQNRQSVEKDITALETEIRSLEQGNRQLTDLIAYFRSPSYQEKEIRRKLNMQKPGEHVVSLPADPGAVLGLPSEASSPAPTPNWRKWWDYFFKQR